MTVEQMRMAISDCYPGREWSKKVDNMSDGQVIAIYRKFESNGKLDPRHPEKKTVDHHLDHTIINSVSINNSIGASENAFKSSRYGEQLSMFD